MYGGPVSPSTCVPDGKPDAPRATATGKDTQQIRRKPVLGGLINEYTHAA
jgi:hypothetical protein